MSEQCQRCLGSGYSIDFDRDAHGFIRKACWLCRGGNDQANSPPERRSS